jgi:uncharacterized protein YndB with AHSA1/START domain
MTRTFDAPRRLVFDAYTRSELIRRWIGRPGDEMTVCDVDLRVGGAYRYVWQLRAEEQGRRGEMAMGGTFREVGTFREIDPPERIVCTESFGDYPGEAVISTIFVEQEGRTTMITTCAYVSQEVRDAVIASGVESGRRRELRPARPAAPVAAVATAGRALSELRRASDLRPGRRRPHPWWHRQTHA